MKGQYLAVETVLSLGLGLIIAIGSIAAFNSYKNGMLNTAEPAQVGMVESEVSSAIYTLGELDTESNGRITLDLPKRVAGSSYQMALNNGELVIVVGGEEYKSDFAGLNETYTFNGTTTGGSVNLFKRQNQFILRAN